LVTVAVISPEKLNKTYRKETDANVKEMILLVRQVRIDDQEAFKVAKVELHRSRWWAYKWLDGFDKLGLEGLKDQTKKWVGIGTSFTNPTKKDDKHKAGVIWKQVRMADQASNGNNL
jgi:hypothetical protein